MLEKTYCFDDVLLIPAYSQIRTRKDVDISVQLSRDLKLNIPIIASPMDTVSGPKMAIRLNELGGIAILHRYCTIERQVKMVEEVVSAGRKVGAAVGAVGDYLERAQSLVEAGVSLLCVDVANGDHILVEEALYHLKRAVSNDIHIMTGNVATMAGFSHNASHGANSVRCGVGGGSMCTTRIQTGHGVPTLQTIMWSSKAKRGGTKIVADGGIKTAGDIVKSLAAGADVVMLGSLLAGTDEAPGEVLNLDGRLYKQFRGMASKEAQTDWRGMANSVEGVTSYSPYKGSVDGVVKGLVDGIRSGLSYSGVRSIKELQEKARFCQISSAGMAESKPHGLR